jgi:signal transduction histidine kinase
MLALAYYRAGGTFHNINKERAITYYNKTIETAKENNLLRPESAGYLNLGALYMDIGDYPKSLDAHEHALALFEQLHDEGGMNSCYMNISSIYVSMGQNVKGMEYARKALKVFETDPAKRGIAVACDVIADLYFKATDAELIAMGVSPANRLKEISATLNKGLKAALQTDDNSLTSNFYRNFGRLNELQGNITVAQQNYRKAADIIGGDMDEESYADNLIALGNFYINTLKDLPAGVGMIHSALVSAKKLGNAESQEEALLALSNAHERQRNFDSALLYFRQAIVVKDTINSKEREQETTRRQLKLDFDIKERDYKNAQQLADVRLKQQEQEILLRNQELQLSDKEKTLQRLTFLQKQAELESQKNFQASQLKEEHQKADYDRKIKDQQINVQNVQLNANRRLSVFLAILAVIILSGATLIYKSRQKTVKLNKLVSEQKLALEDLVKVKDKIFSIVSHDMRAPVNNLIAFSSLLAEGEIGQEKLALYLEQIKSTLDHTSSMMENLLNWSASQMQGFTPVIEDVNICSVVEQVIQGLSYSFEKKKIVLNNTVREDAFVKGDRNMVELITRNLLSNAVKYSNPGGILAIFIEQRNDKITLSVRDNGVGMSQEKADAINSSSVYSVLSTAGTAKEKGTGLGLMLCKHFAAMMQGNIRVESEAGKGSTFNMILPASLAA